MGHWPCFYTNDHVGFRVLKEVKHRLDAFDPDGTKTLWMKTSEIAHYWMRAHLTDVQPSLDEARRECTVRLSTKFPADNFTLAVQDWPAQRVRYDERTCTRSNPGGIFTAVPSSARTTRRSWR